MGELNDNGVISAVRFYSNSAILLVMMTTGIIEWRFLKKRCYHRSA